MHERLQSLTPVQPRGHNHSRFCIRHKLAIQWRFQCISRFSEFIGICSFGRTGRYAAWRARVIRRNSARFRKSEFRIQRSDVRRQNSLVGKCSVLSQRCSEKLGRVGVATAPGNLRALSFTPWLQPGVLPLVAEMETVLNGFELLSAHRSPS